jgi:hypothetical protein
LSHYCDRRGPLIGSIEVIDDHKRTRAGKAIWRCVHHATGTEVYPRTEAIIRLNRLDPIGKP